MDVVEIGEQRLDMGGVYAVKPLAVLAMIDDGELDWKVVAIRSDDPRAAAVNDVEDVERCAPATCFPLIPHFPPRVRARLYSACPAQVRAPAHV